MVYWYLVDKEYARRGDYQRNRQHERMEYFDYRNQTWHMLACRFSFPSQVWNDSVGSLVTYMNDRIYVMAGSQMWYGDIHEIMATKLTHDWCSSSSSSGPGDGKAVPSVTQLPVNTDGEWHAGEIGSDAHWKDICSNNEVISRGRIWHLMSIPAPFMVNGSSASLLVIET
jgi:hypothetical protein